MGYLLCLEVISRLLDLVGRGELFCLRGLPLLYSFSPRDRELLLHLPSLVSGLITDPQLAPAVASGVESQAQWRVHGFSAC